MKKTVWSILLTLCMILSLLPFGAFAAGTVASGDYGDGLHWSLSSDGTLTITGGYTVVCGPTQGDTATLDYDVSGTITGGTFLGTGASGMAQSFSAAEQGVIAVNVGNQSAGSTVTLKDASGSTVFSFTPALSFAVVILSDSSLASGQTYTLTAGSYSGTVTAK